MLRKRDRRKRAAIVLAIVAIVTAEQVQVPNSYGKNDGRARVARVANAIGASCGAFLYTTIGGADDPWNYHADAMWASMERGIPTLNGYSGNQPPGWNFYDIRVHTAAVDSIVSDSVASWASRWKLDPARICRVRTPPG